MALCMSATGCFSIGFLFRFMYQLAVQIMSHRGNSAFGNRFQNGASRFAQMMAVIETAMPEIRPEFTESAFKLMQRLLDNLAQLLTTA